MIFSALEGRARAALAGSLTSTGGVEARAHEEFSAVAVVEEEIALALGNLGRVRAVHAALRLGILRDECIVRTELLQMDPYMRRYAFEDRSQDRDRLHARLLTLSRDAREVDAAEEERLRPLRERLLALLHRHALLGE